VLAVLLSTAAAQEFLCYDRESDIRLQYVGASESYSHADAPWMVNLSFGDKPFCGGSLVNRSTVLTAAHCVRSDMTVRLADEDWTPFGESLRVVRYVVHPDYNTRTTVSGSDLALLRLEEEFDVPLSRLPYLLD